MASKNESPKTPSGADVFAVSLVVKGRVQGVGYRYFAQKAAQALGITGWVRNHVDGSVEAEGEGSRSDLERWIAQLRVGPPLSRVDDIKQCWIAPKNGYKSFETIV